MSLSEILAEIPKLSFAERQELIRRAISVGDEQLTPEEAAILDERIEEFQSNPTAGIPLESLKAVALKQIQPQ